MKPSIKKVRSYSMHVVLEQVRKYEEEGWTINLPPLDREKDKYHNKIWTAELIKKKG